MLCTAMWNPGFDLIWMRQSPVLRLMSTVLSFGSRNVVRPSRAGCEVDRVNDGDVSQISGARVHWRAAVLARGEENGQRDGDGATAGNV